MTRSFAAAAMLLALGAHADPATTIATQIRDAIVLHDRLHFEQLVVDQATRGRETDDLREVIDQYDCVSVRRFDWQVTFESENAVSLRLDLDATGLTKALSRPEVRFPRWWRIDAKRIDGQWKIDAAMSEERWVALQMLAAPSIDAADRIYRSATRHLDLNRLLVEYADALEGLDRLPSLDHALALAREAHDTSAEVFALRTYGTLAIENSASGHLPRVNEALAIALERGSPDDQAEAYFTLGVLHGVFGESGPAVEHLAASAALAERSLNPILPLKAKLMEAYFLQLSGRLFESLERVDELAELSRRFDWAEGEEQVMFRRADVHSELRNHEIALAQYDEIVRVAMRRGNFKFSAYALHNSAPHEVALGRPEKALAAIERAAALWPDVGIQPTIYTSLASVYIELGRYDEAEEALRKAELAELAIAKQDRGLRPSYHRARSELSLRRGRIAEAIEQAQVALASMPDASEFNRENEDALSHQALGRAYRAAGRIDEAIEHLRRSVNATEIRRASVPAGEAARIAYFSDHLTAYTELVELLVERGKNEEAFRIAEQMKGRALRDVIAGGRIDLSAAMTAAERAREEELEGRVLELNRGLQQNATAALRAELADARRRLDAYDTEMRLKYPGLAARRAGPRDAADDAIELPRGARSLAVVEYVVANEQTIAFCLAPAADGTTALHVARLPVGRAELERLAARFATLVGSRSLTYRAEARTLYARLVQPLERHLAGLASVAIVPDGVLWTVPFHALIAGDGAHLVERQAVFYAHSLALLRHATTRAASPRPRLIAFGNPAVSSSVRANVRSAYRDAAVGALPEAEAEVRSLRTMYSPERSRAYWRKAASETAFKSEAQKFDIIHVAAHAVIDDLAPMYSAIILAANSGDRSEDGLLEAREVADLPLKADLAVLSACDTARGKVGAGEGVIGIAWAFFAAGCPTTVVSQWKAESRATSKLMVEFHRRLLAGDTVAEALRRAQLAVRKDPRYAHPFYWAPFVAIGGAAKDAAGSVEDAGRPR
ncbi:MAG TPA: CHAT domain-containing protein [Thermoanaerobaculia bacterium]